MTRAAKEKPTPESPKDFVVCLVCGKKSGTTGDRFREFMGPHFKTKCGQYSVTMAEIFEWKRISGNSAEANRS